MIRRPEFILALPPRRSRRLPGPAPLRFWRDDQRECSHILERRAVMGRHGQRETSEDLGSSPSTFCSTPSQQPRNSVSHLFPPRKRATLLEYGIMDLPCEGGVEETRKP